MKYIDAEKLKTKIEKRKANIKTYCLQPNHDRRYDVVPEQLSYILSDIDSLQQEQSEVDLEQAAEDFVWEVMENDEDGISELSMKLRPSSKISDFYDALAEFFKAGAKWAIEQLKEK